MTEAPDLLLERLHGIHSAATWEENRREPIVAPAFPAFRKHFLGLVAFDATSTEHVTAYFAEVFHRLHQVWEHADVAEGKEAMLHTLDQILEQAPNDYPVWLAHRLDREPLNPVHGDKMEAEPTQGRSRTHRLPAHAIGDWRSEQWPTERWTTYPERPIRDMSFAFRGLPRRDCVKLFRQQVLTAATGIQRLNPRGNRGHGPFVMEQGQALDALQHLANKLVSLRAELDQDGTHLSPAEKATRLEESLNDHKSSVLDKIRAAAAATERERQLDALPVIGSHAGDHEPTSDFVRLLCSPYEPAIALFKSNSDRSDGSLELDQQSLYSLAQRHASTSAQPILAQRPAIPEEVIRRRPTSAAEPVASSEAAPADESVISDETHTFHATTTPLTQQQLSLLYAYTTPPPESALAAFAARVSLPVTSYSSTTSSASSNSAPAPISLENELELVEQALIHESFWDGVRALQDSVALADSANRRFTNFHDAPLETIAAGSGTVTHAHNGSLAALGNSLLGTFATELVLESFPHLPTRAAKAALTLYVGPKSLANVAQSSWGVGPTRLERALVGKEDQGKVSRKDRAYGHLQQGRGGARKVGNEVGAKEGAAGPGLVRWNRKPMSPTKDAVLFEDALASVARALVGVVHETHGFAAARSFCRAHFLSRLVPPSASTSLASPAASSDILPLLKFSNPNRVLSLSLTSHGLPPLRHALLKESGRLTAHPTFVTGAFSGDVKLGEGFGSSLRMSEWRASEDALRRVYLGGGRVEGGVPTDAWASAAAEANAFKGWKNASGWTEVEHESR